MPKSLAKRISQGEKIPFADFPDDYIFDGHAAASGTIFWIDMFEIPEEHRLKGHGRAFYTALEAWILDEDEPKTSEIRLMAADTGEGPSDKFWTKMGFKAKFQNPKNRDERHTLYKRVR
jgi:GNAT superfamily N-acetyltransferase